MDNSSTIDRAELHARIYEIYKAHCRIVDENGRYVQLGRQCADDFWNGPDRHPLTALRRGLKPLRHSQDMLDFRFGFQIRLREIDEQA
jgi:hypothetical protein